MSTGKHLICDIKEIKNEKLLNNIKEVKQLLDEICKEYNYTILNKNEHIFEPQGFTILYLLSESHISIHTYPEHNYIAMDLYTCRHYNDNEIYEEIYNKIIEKFDAKKEICNIIERSYR